MAAHFVSETIIRPRHRFGWPDFGEMWAFRELLWVLAFRDIKIRYKQTTIGIFWAVLQPAIAMIVMTMVFGRLAKVPSDGMPYPLFVLTGLLPWQCFSKALTQGSMSMVSMQGMLTKVYFPRLFAPLSEIFSGLVDFCIGMILLVAMMLWYGVTPGWNLLAIPCFVVLLVLNALAISLWLSALNVEYRDVQFVLPFFAQIWMFLTPVVYPLSLVPEQWKWVYMINPISGPIEGFRWALLGGGAPTVSHMLISFGCTVVVLVSGMRYFDKSQRTLPDRV